MRGERYENSFLGMSGSMRRSPDFGPTAAERVAKRASDLGMTAVEYAGSVGDFTRDIAALRTASDELLLAEFADPIAGPDAGETADGAE